jgi:hypothetical protein
MRGSRRVERLTAGQVVSPSGLPDHGSFWATYPALVASLGLMVGA